jgi:DNA repair exonuclease SbcCD ATPase subunit
MTQISEIEARLSSALEGLRGTLAGREAAVPPPAADADLQERAQALEEENAALKSELERLREKRDKDVAALDELIVQLKPLIKEV